ncbi:MAG: MBL fold metallo-hydrolase [Steroidobacteraceae bacterium]
MLAADTEIRNEINPGPGRIRSFFHAPSNTWSHVVSDPQTGKAAVIDPVLDYEANSGRTSATSVEQIIVYLREHSMSLEWILETHAHADHLSAANELKRAVGGRTAIGAGIVKVQSTFKRIYNLGADFVADGRQFDRLLQDGDEIVLGDLTGKVLATPGHTSDSVTYLFGDAAFVGDTVFMPDGGTARCDFPGGDAAELYRSIRRLYQLPENTRIFVCHDYPPDDRAPLDHASVADHKQRNSHLSAATTEAAFIQFRKGRDATLDLPALIIPAVQVNIRAGCLPPAEDNGVAYLKVPLNLLGHKHKPLG